MSNGNSAEKHAKKIAEEIVKKRLEEEKFQKELEENKRAISLGKVI